MIKPSKLVNRTRIIQMTALSIPRALASRATHTNSAMFKTKTAMGMKISDPQRAHPAADAAGSGWVRCAHTEAEHRSGVARRSLRCIET